MKLAERPSLRTFNTFGVESSAQLMLELEYEEDILSIPSFNPETDLILGGGSNVLFVSDVPGTVLLNRIAGKDVVETAGDHVWIEAGAGENWHELVRWTLSLGYSGLENLSLIPGLAGAAPIQNIGAYGVELASVLESVTAWDLEQNKWSTLSSDQCHLAYRDSLFKSGQPDRYLITSIRLRLNTVFRPQLEYAGLRDELAQSMTGQPTAMDVSDAVIRLRQRKLPDPSVTGNAGSFFKNPELPADTAAMLKGQHPDMPAWPQDNGAVKLSAAWMIEHCGLKNCRRGDAGVSDRHALVLVNHGSASGRDILELSVRIQSEIFDTFGVRLEPEPRIIHFPL